MKKWNATNILTVLVTGAVLMSGCLSPVPANTTPVITPAPKIENHIILVSPLSIPAIAVPEARYSVGDIVWRNDSNFDIGSNNSRGMIITRVYAQSYHYQYVTKGDSDVLWSQIFPNPQTDNFTSFENYYPRQVDHVSTITSQYSSMAEFNAAMAREYWADYC